MIGGRPRKIPSCNKLCWFHVAFSSLARLTRSQTIQTANTCVLASEMTSPSSGIYSRSQTLVASLLKPVDPIAICFKIYWMELLFKKLSAELDSCVYALCFESQGQCEASFWLFKTGEAFAMCNIAMLTTLVICFKLSRGKYLKNL